MSSTQITHHAAPGNVPELRTCLKMLWKCCSAWALSLNLHLLWPLLQKWALLYCRPKRRWDIKRCSLTCAMRCIQWWKRGSNASIKAWLIVCPSILRACLPDLCICVCLRVCAYMCVCAGVRMCYPVPLWLCVGIQTCLSLNSLDVGHLHSGMRNRFRFGDSFQAPLFAVTFKSKSIPAAPVVLLLG